jgi:hypothetical protein
MDIHILTHGRHGRQITFENLPAKWQDQVSFVIQERELPKWKEKWGNIEAHRFIVLPDHIRNLHQTRQWLLHESHDHKVVEMDDDLVFSARRTDDPTKFRNMTEQDFDDMFYEIEEQLDYAPLVGVSHREGANRNTHCWLYNTRQMRVHAYDARLFRRNNYRWDLLRSPGPEDFCLTLQVLTSGERNIVCNEWVHNQGGSNQDGGCSEYRTLEVHGDACEHLAELFPDFVKVVEKPDVGGWGGKRKDVRIQWKKAYEYGKSKAGVPVLG